MMQRTYLNPEVFSRNFVAKEAIDGSDIFIRTSKM